MERSSPSRTAGVVLRKAMLGGVEYVLSIPDKVRKSMDEEAVVISRRLDMLPALARSCAALPENERAAWRQDYIASMLCGIASPQEWTSYYRSPWQLAFRFWNALDPMTVIDSGDPDPRKRQPRLLKRDITLLEGVGWAYEHINNDDTTNDEMDALWLAVRAVSQEDELGKSSGCQEEVATPLTATQSTVDGQQS